MTAGLGCFLLFRPAPWGIDIPMNEIPDAMIWKGPPSQERIWAIQFLVRTDDRGRRYFRERVDRPWRALRTADDFRLLNAAIDRSCPERRVGG